MAQTNVTGDVVNKLFSSALLEEAKKQCHFFSSDLIGDGKVLALKDELSKRAGDQITYQLTTIPTSVGRSSGQTLENNEQALPYYTDTLVIDSLREAIRIPGDMSMGQKKVGFDWRKSAMNQLAKWAAVSMEIGIMNALGGNTATSWTNSGRTYAGADVTKGTGMNASTAPTSNRIKIAGGQATDQALTSSDTFTLNLVDACLEEAEITNEGAGRIQPISVDGQDSYIMFISHEQFVDLKRDNSSAIQWFDIQTAALQGGMIDSNPIYTNAVGKYGNVIFKKSSYLPQGVNTSDSTAVANTKRAVFCGAGAGCIAFGNAGGPGDSAMSWTERDIDFDEDLGVAVRLTWGASKAVFNGEDAGVIVASSYAAPHNS